MHSFIITKKGVLLRKFQIESEQSHAYQLKIGSGKIQLFENKEKKGEVSKLGTFQLNGQEFTINGYFRRYEIFENGKNTYKLETEKKLQLGKVAFALSRGSELIGELVFYSHFLPWRQKMRVQIQDIVDCPLLILIGCFLMEDLTSALG